MSIADLICYVSGAFIFGAVLGHRLLPPRLDSHAIEREHMLLALDAEALARAQKAARTRTVKP